MSGMPEADDIADAPDEQDEAPARERLPLPDEHDAAYIEERDDLRRLADHMATCASVAIDTEANSMHAYREQTCIMQVTAGGRSAIVDVLAVEDLSPVREALDRDDVEIVLHGGDYDITVLTRDHDFRFGQVFDTMIAATLLGDERVGLASLVEDHFGHTLEKRFQRADWARRPLSDEHLDYLRRDTMYLSTLRAHYGDRLREADLEEEAAIEFRRLAARRGSAPTFDGEGWRRIKGAARLDDRGRTVLRQLFLWRDAQAERRDVPPFKVLGPKTLLAIAERPPKEFRGPRDISFLGARERQRHGRALVEVLSKARQEYNDGVIPPKSITPPVPPEEAKLARVWRNREERVKDWRRKEARKRDVPNVVVLPNPGMVWMVREMPGTVAEIASCDDIGPKRAARYGEAWLNLLSKG